MRSTKSGRERRSGRLDRMGKREFFLRAGDWPGRVEGRRGTRGGTSLLAGTSREARLCGDSLGERERDQNNHSRVQVHWSLSGALLLLGCDAMAYR